MAFSRGGYYGGNSRGGSRGSGGGGGSKPSSKPGMIKGTQTKAEAAKPSPSKPSK